MTRAFIDLHCHTSASFDCLSRPADVVKAAAKRGLTHLIVTDHDRKPEFDAVWAKWMPEGKGPVRSFVQSVMPDGDQVEIIMTVALPADFKG